MSNEKTKNIVLAVLVVGIIGITVAYALLTQRLVIENNSATISKANWDIHFESSTPVTAVATSLGDTQTATVDSQPTLTATTISGLQATFKKPGDNVAYKFNVVNNGDINAKLKHSQKAQLHVHHQILQN